jgi:hypothetical protein
VLFLALGIIFLNFSLLWANKTFTPDDIPRLFLEANQAYKNGDFQKAVYGYQRIISLGIINGEIFYNLGNAYLKSGDVGKAILNYRKSEMLMPRNEDLQANLEYALGLTRDRIECKEFFSFFGRLCFWHSKLNTKELITVFLALNFFLWALLIIKMYYNREIVSMTMYVCIFFTLVLGISTGVKIYNIHFIHRGIVVAREIMVRSGFSINDTVLFKLHEGTEFTWGKENTGWIKIHLCDGKKGWVLKNLVEKISL